MSIGACESLLALISVYTRATLNSKRTVKTKLAIIIAPSVKVQVPIAYNSDVPSNRDFLFKL